MINSVLQKIIFRPPQCTYFNDPRTIIWLTTKSKEHIPAKYIPYKGATKTILFSHGNAEDMGSCEQWVNYLSKQLKVNVMIYEYTGYGLSTGVPSEEKLYEDIRCAYDYLVNTLRIPPREIILYGRSLGTGPTIHLAAELGNEIFGVILQSPFRSVLTTKIPKSFMKSLQLKDMFLNEQKILKVKAPIIIIHGTRDVVVPFSHGKKLASAKNNCKLVGISGASHNNIERCFKEVVLPQLNNFIGCR